VGVQTTSVYHFDPRGATRDPLAWPFATSSIWNTPIGSGAVYHTVHANGTGLHVYTGDWDNMPAVDPMRIVLSPASPATSIVHSNGGWGGDRCVTGGSGGGLPVTVPIPADYVVPSDGENSCAVFLAADGRTIKQCQPFARCVASGSGTAMTTFADEDLYGAGTGGAQGGSFLSAYGGTIRMGELRPGQTGPRHVLKIDLNTVTECFNGSTMAQCYRWPATAADGDAVGTYGTGNSSPYAGMVMGSLLAIPASTDITGLGLESEPGAQVAWTLQNYGAYVVDRYQSGYSIPAENGPAGVKDTEFYSDYGYHLAARVIHNTPWMRDFGRLVAALQIVDNNTVSTAGGGGTPRQPLAPPISPP
jgi:hypothetical protein